MTMRFAMLICLICFLGSACFGQDEFDQLSAAFKQKAATSLGIEATQSEDSLSVYVSKKTISSAINTAVNTSQVSIATDIQQKSFDNIPPLPVKIGKIIKNCDIINCDGCNQDCGDFDPFCAADKLQCNIRRGVCLGAKLAAEAPCYTAKALTDALNGVTVVEFHFSDIKAKGNVTTTAINIAVKDDLSSVKLESDLNANLEVDGQATPHVNVLAGVSTGCLPIQPPLAINSIPVPISNKSISFDSKFEQLPSDEGTKLRVTIEKANFKLTTNIKPFLMILHDNPHFYLTCVVAAIPLEVAGIVDMFFPINITTDQSLANIGGFDVGLITIKDFPTRPKNLKLTPTVNTLSLGAVEKKLAF